MYLYPASPATLVPNLATAWGPPPTWVLPVISPPGCCVSLSQRQWLPSLMSPMLSLVTNACPSRPVIYSSLPAIFHPRLSYAVFPPPLNVKMCTSFILPPHIPFILCTPQKLSTAPPTVPPSPVISLYRSSPILSLPLPSVRPNPSF